MAGNEDGQKRRCTDRRSRKRPPLKYLIFGGRRASARRDSDKKDFIFVDRYSPRFMLLFVLLVVLSIADGIFTLYLLEHGATETNPIMAFFLNMGPWSFMIAKFFLTCSGLLCLLVLHNFYIRPLRTRVKIIFPAFIAIFILILGWQIYLNFVKNAI